MNTKEVFLLLISAGENYQLKRNLLGSLVRCSRVIVHPIQSSILLKCFWGNEFVSRKTNEKKKLTSVESDKGKRRIVIDDTAVV